MHKIQAILVDDEPRGLTSLKKKLELYCQQVEVLATCTGAEEAQDAILRLRPQLIFLDIAMPGQSGFDLLERLPEIDFEIIFVTAHHHHMLQAFHFSAVDYLLKPVDHELLIEAVHRAAKKVTEKIDTRNIKTLLHNIRYGGHTPHIKLCIPSLKGFQIVEIRDILYCAAEGSYTSIVFPDRMAILSSKVLHEYESLLSDCRFLRIHKSYLVNLDHIKEYVRGEGGSVIMRNGDELEVSRRKKEPLVSWLKEYYKY
jgi:two-component system LytT family response regulator